MAEDEVTLHKKLEIMKLHEEITLDNGILIKKVIGGWFYWKQLGNLQTVSMVLAGVFVPAP